MALLRIEGNPPCRMVRPWGFMQAWEPAPHRHTIRQGGFWFAFPRLGKDALITDNRTNELTTFAPITITQKSRSWTIFATVPFVVARIY